MHARSIALLVALVVAAAIVLGLVRSSTSTPQPAMKVAETTSDTREAEAVLDAPASLSAADQSAERIVEAIAAQAPEAETPAATDSTATLNVRAVTRVDELPLAGVQITAIAEGPLVPEVLRRQRALTDEHGVVAITVPAQAAIELRLSTWSCLTADVDVPALAIGETRDVAVPLECSVSLVRGSVLAEDDGSPIAGAHVRVQRRGVRVYRAKRAPLTIASTTTRADGSYELRVHAGETDVLEVAAPGFATTVSFVPSAEDAAKGEHTILLRRAARLDVHITDERAEPREPLDVELLGNAHDGERTLNEIGFTVRRNVGQLWRARVDADGRAQFDDLRPSTGLALTITCADAELWKERDPIVLTPGETRELHIRIRGVDALRCRVTDAHGTAVEDQEIWLVPARSEQAELFVRGVHQPTAKQTTDASGTCAFASIPPGRWWIGPAPRDGFTAPKDAVAGLAQTIEITDASRTVEIDLPVFRDLFIRGEARDANGKPLNGGRVTARVIAERTMLLETIEHDGTFLVGPLIPGDYALVAHGPGFGGASDEVVVAAGTDGVRLTLLAGGAIAGHCVDGVTRAPIEASVRLQEAGTRPRSSVSVDAFLTSFRFGDLMPGTYDVLARSADGGIGVRKAVLVESERTTEDVVVELVRGGTLRVKLERGAGTFVQAWCDGVQIASGALEPGIDVLALLPPGRATVRIGTGGDTTEHAIDIAPGAERTLTVSR
ncbi:MAG: collagen binding domain-containing protein [Planctomycetota bacterium]